MTADHLAERSAALSGNAGKIKGTGPFLVRSSDETFSLGKKENNPVLASINFVTMHGLYHGVLPVAVPVRVGYRCVSVPGTSKQSPRRYRLERFESSDPRIDPLVGKAENGSSPRRMIVAEGLKGCSVRCVMPTRSSKTQSDHTAFVWGDDDVTRYALPQYVEFTLAFADEQSSDVVPLSLVIPVYGWDAQAYRITSQSQERGAQGA